MSTQESPWIKASERLQIDDHEYVFLKGCRVHMGILRNENIYGQEIVTLYYHDGFGISKLSSWCVGHPDLAFIQWLDESLLTPTIFANNKEVEGRFAEWAVANGWSFNFSDEDWSRSHLLETCGPLTTAELIKEWKKSLKKNDS